MDRDIMFGPKSGSSLTLKDIPQISVTDDSNNELIPKVPGTPENENAKDFDIVTNNLFPSEIHRKLSNIPEDEDAKSSDTETDDFHPKIASLSISQLNFPGSKQSKPDNGLVRLCSPTPYDSKSLDEIVQLFNALPRVFRQPYKDTNEWYISLRQITNDHQGRHCLLIMHTQYQVFTVFGPFQTGFDIPKDSTLRETLRRHGTSKRLQLKAMSEAGGGFEGSRIFENDVVAFREAERIKMVSRAILQNFLELDLGNPNANVGRPYLFFTDEVMRAGRLLQEVRDLGISEPYDMQVASDEMRILSQRRWEKLQKYLVVRKKNGVERIMIEPSLEWMVKKGLIKVFGLGCVGTKAVD